MTEPSASESIVEGAWDTHVHAGPDSSDRKLDIYELAKAATRRKMGGLVVKNHAFPTAMLTRFIGSRPDVDVDLVGTLVLNRSVGGLNPDAVVTASKFGTGRIELPTKSAKQNMLDQGVERTISITSDRELTDEAAAVLDAVLDQGMVLGTGHIGVEEVVAVTEYISSRDGTVVVTHPELHRTRDGIGMSTDIQAEIATDGVYFERCALVFKPGIQDHLLPEVSPSNVTPALERDAMLEHMAEGIRATGVDHNFISTDFGQPHNPTPPDGLVDFHETLRSEEFSRRELTVMAKESPEVAFGSFDQ